VAVIVLLAQPSFIPHCRSNLLIRSGPDKVRR
jgi:hypothetical protein